MNKVDGMPSNMNNNNNINRGMTESNPNLPPISNNFNTESINNAIQSNVSTERPVIQRIR